MLNLILTLIFVKVYFLTYFLLKFIFNNYWLKVVKGQKTTKMTISTFWKMFESDLIEAADFQNAKLPPVCGGNFHFGNQQPRSNRSQTFSKTSKLTFWRFLMFFIQKIVIHSS